MLSAIACSKSMLAVISRWRGSVSAVLARREELGADDEEAKSVPRDFDLTEQLRPRAVMIENVRGLLGGKVRAVPP